MWEPWVTIHRHLWAYYLHNVGALGENSTAICELTIYTMWKPWVTIHRYLWAYYLHNVGASGDNSTTICELTVYTMWEPQVTIPPPSVSLLFTQCGSLGWQFIAICELTTSIYAMWEPKCITVLWASTAHYRYSFTLLYVTQKAHAAIYQKLSTFK
jgi:hypothetical protein